MKIDSFVAYSVYALLGLPVLAFLHLHHAPLVIYVCYLGGVLAILTWGYMRGKESR